MSKAYARENISSMLRLFPLERDERASGKFEYIADLNNNKYTYT